MLIYALIFIIASLVLIKSSAVLVKALVNIARFMRWSEFIVSFVLMAIATSFPELFVGISAGLQNISSLALGNVIGANILNLTLIAGLIILFSRGTKIRSKIIKRDAWLIFALAVLPFLFLLNKTLSRIEALILVGVFIAYLVYLIKQKQAFPRALNKFPEINNFFKSIGFFIAGLVLLLASSWLIVYSVGKFAQGLNASLILAGIFLVALGTTLPEFVFGLRAVFMKHEEMHIGNLLGSVVANSALILGTTALISPIKINGFSNFLIGAVFMVLALLLFNLFIKTRSKLSWWEGALLIVFYIIFVIVQLAF